MTVNYNCKMFTILDPEFPISSSLFPSVMTTYDTNGQPCVAAMMVSLS
jgi:hypothetical protein